MQVIPVLCILVLNLTVWALMALIILKPTKHASIFARMSEIDDQEGVESFHLKRI